MAFLSYQLERVKSALSSKLSTACPGCNLPGRRQVMPDLFLFVSHTPYPPPPPNPYKVPSPPPGSPASILGRLRRIPPGLANPTMPPPGATPSTMPCVVTVCTNCGFTEFYNVHVLGVASDLGVPPPGDFLG